MIKVSGVALRLDHGWKRTISNRNHHFLGAPLLDIVITNRQTIGVSDERISDVLALGQKNIAIYLPMMVF
jgi:hypothetical protein